MSDYKPTICLDFDGVIHAYDSPWTNKRDVADGPTPGAKEAIEKLVERFEVKVFSTRCESHGGYCAIRDFMEEYGFHKDVKIAETKPPAVLYVDDRGYRFDGNWDALLEFVADEDKLTPWNKRGEPRDTADTLIEVLDRAGISATTDDVEAFLARLDED